MGLLSPLTVNRLRVYSEEVKYYPPRSTSFKPNLSLVSFKHSSCEMTFRDRQAVLFSVRMGAL